jgi:hypothetical protein
MRLRDAVGISDLDYLPHELAIATLGDCEVIPLKNIPTLTVEQLTLVRTYPSRFGALAIRIEDRMSIVFNDVHPPLLTRVHLMEELFHLRLGHAPDNVRISPVDGHRRTHCAKKEHEAHNCGIAALVPFGGLLAMLAGQAHVARIAEHFGVPVDTVQERIAATNLGDVANARHHQLALVPGEFSSLISSYR